MMCSDFVLDCVMVECRLAMMADDRCVADAGGWESDAQFAAGVVVIAGVDIHKDRVHARYRSVLCHLKVKF